jgi:hypothetical protein
MSGEVIQLPGQYEGGEAISGNDANQAATIPSGTTTVIVMAEGGPVYCAVNGTASTSSPFYCPEDQARILGPYSNLKSLGVYAATGDTAHLAYES